METHFFLILWKLFSCPLGMEEFDTENLITVFIVISLDDFVALETKNLLS